MKEKQARFHIYRYQLLPVNRHFQADLYGAKTVEELISQKNNLFNDAINSDLAFKTSKTNTSVQKLIQQDDFMLFRIAVSRSLNHETRDFKTEVIDNWPKILVAIWNDPDKQLIAIQHRTTAFKDTDAAIKLIFNSIQETLSKYQLVAMPEPTFEKHIFWDLIKKNVNKVQEIEFEIITPNMANISGALPDDLKSFAKETNSVKNKLSISSDPDSALKIDENNPVINGLVEYSSKGGGDISIKISGYSKKIHTSKTVKEFSLNEAELIGDPKVVSAF